MMRLVGEDNIELELGIDGYQFPDASEHWDANWLLVRGRVAHPRGPWSFSDPCLTTSEVEQLAAWLDSIVAGRPSPDARYFVEPNLRFAYVASPVPTVEVTLAYESAPPWLTDRGDRLDGVAVTFPLSMNDLKEASRSLRHLLTEFPPRGVPDDAA
jgi:hypothetical protein